MTPMEVRRYSKACFNLLYPPDYYIEVPCGRCQSCEKRRLRDYQIRLLFELDRYPNSVFVTLTFNDENLEKFKDNPNAAVRLFVDRVRKYFGKSVRHWFVAEFGSLRGRLHYHGLLFNVPARLDAELLVKLWKYGFVWLGYANARTAKYICKYVTKSINGFRRPPRIIASKGVGLSYLTPENVSFHLHGGKFRPYIMYRGLKVPLPRYYYDKIFTDDIKIEMALDRYYNPPDKWYCNGVTYYDKVQFMLARRALFERNKRLGLSFDYKQFKKQKNGSIKNSSELRGEGA